MIKEIISNRNEDYTFFIQCSCGQEIVQFYYYKETNLDNEIIGLKYFGHIDNHQDTKCANFEFTRESFNNLIEALHYSIKADHFGYLIEDHSELLAVRKDKLGFYNLVKFRNLSRKNKELKIWDICLYKDQVLELIDKLEEMLRYVIEG